MNNDSKITMDEAFDRICTELHRHVCTHGGLISQSALVSTMLGTELTPDNNTGAVVIHALEEMVKRGDLKKLELFRKGRGNVGETYYLNHDTEIRFTLNKSSMQ